MASEQENYPAAIRGYKAAIENALKAEVSPDIALNLILCLAETFRRAGRLDECGQVLKSLEPVVLDGSTAKDPLLPVRYWRRVRDLAIDRKQQRLAGVASSKAMIILSRNCRNHNSDRYLSSWAAHMEILATDTDPCPTLDALLLFANENSQMLRSGTHAQVTFDHACEVACRQMLFANGPANLGPALRKIQGLPRHKACAASTLELWFAGMSLCLKAGRTELIAPYLEDVYKALATVPDSSSRSHVAKLMCRQALFDYLQHARQDDKSQIESLRRLYQTFGPDEQCIPEERAQKMAFCANLLWKMQTSSSSSVDARTQMVAELEDLTRKVRKFDHNNQSTREYIEGQIFLFEAYAREHRLDEAEAVLSGISPDSIGSIEPVDGRRFCYLNLGKYHAVLAAQYAANGQMQKSLAHSAQAKLVLAKVTVESDRSEIIAEINRAANARKQTKKTAPCGLPESRAKKFEAQPK